MEKDIKYKPKIRVQSLNEEGIVISDRLVDQAIEFMNGPKESHDGPLRIEVNLMSTDDIPNFITYLNKLVGKLPIKENRGKGRPANSSTQEFNSPREEVLSEIEKLSFSGINQDELINHLRKLGFVFLLTEDFKVYFPEFPFKSRDIKEPNSTGQYPESFCWMVRRIKFGKDPKTDKYDPQIIFGIKLLSNRDDKVVPYLYKERKKPLYFPVPTKNMISFNNTEMVKFPKYMLEEERLKFSTEMRQCMYNKEKKPSKFFLRWFPDVVFPTSIQKTVEEIRGRK